MGVTRIIRMDKARADDAWAAHQALIKAEVEIPELSHNPIWQCLRMDAYEAFCRAFDGEG